MNKYNSNYRYICFVIIVFIIGNLSVVVGWGNLRYIRFVTPLFLLPIVGNNTWNINLKITKIENVFYRKIIVVLCICTVTTFVSNFFIYSVGYTMRNFFNSLIILIPPIFCLVILNSLNFKDLSRLLYFLFYCFILQYIYFLFHAGISLTGILKTLNSNFISNSDFSTESIDPLFFCFFALLFISKKDWKHFSIAILFTIIGGKRVALLGLILSVFVYYTFNYLNRYKFFNKKTIKILIPIYISIAIILANFWQVVYSGKYDDIFSYYTGLSTDALFMGRANIITSFFNNLRDDSIPFLGFGLGYVENVLTLRARFTTLFHNDFLRLYLEMGFIMFTYWLYIMIKYSFISALNFSLLILLIVLMQTDNVIVYDKVMIPFFLIFSFGIRKAYYKSYN